MVAALAVANPIGSVYMPDGKTFWAWPWEIAGEFGGARPVGDQDCSDPIPELSRLDAMGRLQAGANTTLVVVASTATAPQAAQAPPSRLPVSYTHLRAHETS